MTLNISATYPSLAVRTTARSGRYLVAGKHNVVELGEKVARFFSMKGSRVDEVASFDPEKGVSLCEVGVQTVASLTKVQFGVDTMICLDDESLEFESLVIRNGKVLADGSSVTRGPKRSDLYFVMVPTQLLAERIRHNWNGELGRHDVGGFLTSFNRICLALIKARD